MRVLFITSNRLGDAVLSTGILAHLVETLPDARFTIACGPIPAPLFAAVPRLDEIIELRKGPRLAHWRRLLGQTMGHWWHMVVDLRGSATAWVLPTMHRRIFTAADRRSSTGHRVEQLAAMMRVTPPPAPYLWLSPEAEQAAEELLGSDTRPLLAVGPTANWMAKTWPAECFTELARRLSADGAPLAGARILVAGAPNERLGAEPVLDAFVEAGAVDLIGTADLPTLAACLARATLYVGNDSGLMHLAAAVGAPTLGLFGPSRDEHYRPWGAHCGFVRSEESYDTLLTSPHFHPDPTESLMTGLSVEVAELAARNMLECLP